MLTIRKGFPVRGVSLGVGAVVVICAAGTVSALMPTKSLSDQASVVVSNNVSSTSKKEVASDKKQNDKEEASPSVQSVVRPQKDALSNATEVSRSPEPSASPGATPISSPAPTPSESPAQSPEPSESPDPEEVLEETD